MVLNYYEPHPDRDVAVYCVATSSLECTGWCRRDSSGDIVTEGGGEADEIDRMVNHVVRDLVNRRVVALGVQLPLSIPMPTSAADLFPPRAIDKGFSWGAGLGAIAAAGAMQLLQYMLSSINDGLARAAITYVTAGLDFDDLGEGEPRIVLWEAIDATDDYGVREECREMEGTQVARAAVEQFLATFADGGPWSFEDRTMLSLAGAALLYANFESAPTVLHLAPPAVRFSRPSKEEVGVSPSGGWW